MQAILNILKTTLTFQSWMPINIIIQINIFFSINRIKWKLADFGIAKLLTMTAQQNYYTDTFAGNYSRICL